MRASTDVILPIAKKLMQPDQAAKASAEGYLASTLMHEISHELGPAFARRNGKQVDIREAIGPAYSGLEEAKADVVGMFGLKWLVDHGALPKDRLARILRLLCRRHFPHAALRHRRSARPRRDDGVQLSAGTTARWRWSAAATRSTTRAFPACSRSFAKRLLEMEAAGDRAGAEAWFAKYDKIPAELQKALAATSGIPVDIDPVFSFPDRIE